MNETSSDEALSESLDATPGPHKPIKFDRESITLDLVSSLKSVYDRDSNHPDYRVKFPPLCALKSPRVSDPTILADNAHTKSQPRDNERGGRQSPQPI